MPNVWGHFLQFTFLMYPISHRPFKLDMKWGNAHMMGTYDNVISWATTLVH